MGANRKLQIEIDRTLKKVAEGIDVFDEIWEKVYETDQVPLKEKYELDLKKEIKKLQRYRDTIKTWISGSDIKDKTALIEARKSVERQMERFKVCEKETKTKTFSKEGLAQAQKQDPRERARNEIRDWINTTVDTLTTEAENFDAEVESLQSNKKRGKPPPRLAHAEESVSRHRAHINRLEQVLRLLDNEAIEPEDVNESKDMVEDYLQRNQDDFDDFAEPDDLYADLLDQLDNLESQQPAAVSHIGKVSGLKDKESKDREKEREKERSAAMAMKMQLAQGGHNVNIDEVSPEKPPPPPAPRKVPEIRPPPPAPRQAAQTSRADMRESSNDLSEPPAAVGGSAPSTPMRAPVQGHMPDLSFNTPTQAADKQRQQPGAIPNATSPYVPGLPAVSTTSFAAAASAALNSPHPTPRVESPYRPASLGNESQQHAVGTPQRDAAQLLMQNASANFRQADPLPNSQASSINGPPVSRPAPGGVLGMGWPTAVDSEATAFKDGTARPEEAVLLNHLPQSSTMAEIEDMEAPDLPQMPSAAYSNPQLQLLSAAAMKFLPTPTDRVWGGPAMSRMMPYGAPPSYPDTKLPQMEQLQFYENLDVEALFFAFYYQPESLQQYLAARDLKRQSWRFHKQHGTWFQRHEEPTLATDEYEMGTYVYFDYSLREENGQPSGWCYRLKQDFTFRYDALEDELM